jgi:hypothetical protein
MASIVVAGDTSGTVTLTAPLVAGTTTLTLPTVNGTVLTSASSVARSQLPAGSVLQVVQTSRNTTISTTSISFVTTGFSASITPTSSTSRILVLISGVMYTNTTAAEPQIAVYRGGTNITSDQLGDVFSSAGQIVGSVSGMYLDSPATTSSTTYTIFYKQGNGGVPSALAFLGVNQCQTNIILMEIAA